MVKFKLTLLNVIEPRRQGGTKEHKAYTKAFGKIDFVFLCASLSPWFKKHLLVMNYVKPKTS